MVRNKLSREYLVAIWHYVRLVQYKSQSLYCAVQGVVTVTRRRDSHKPNHYTKLKCSSVDFQCKDSERSAKNLSSSKNTSKAFSRSSVHFTRNMETDGSSDLLENFHHNIWRHTPEASPPPNETETLKCTMTKESLRKVTAKIGRNYDEIYLNVSVK